MNMKRGTPGYGIVIGGVLVALGALVMLIGFWKTLVLGLLFAVGYFLGAAENKGELIREAANRVIPKKEPEAIDLRSELVKEQKARSEQLDQDDQEASETEKETAEE